ncbi:SRPBCC domain-containing protein [Nocardia sp. NPDC048505]|uniref:type II toxin-antitoxin system Rv0910 family toxin n=1 Tax=unclassified Nocardia TaxID=2637762 RepID=UPI0033F90907
MGTIVVTRQLPATPAALFDTITHPVTWQHWFTIHRHFVGDPPERLGAGSPLTSKVVLLGMTNTVEWTVREAQAPTRLVLHGRGMAGVTCEFVYQLRPTDTGTEVTAGGDFSGPLITGLLAAALEKQGRAQLDKTLTRLAAYATRAS